MQLNREIFAATRRVNATQNMMTQIRDFQPQSYAALLAEMLHGGYSWHQSCDTCVAWKGWPKRVCTAFEIPPELSDDEVYTVSEALRISDHLADTVYWDNWSPDELWGLLNVGIEWTDLAPHVQRAKIVAPTDGRLRFVNILKDISRCTREFLAGAVPDPATVEHLRS